MASAWEQEWKVLCGPVQPFLVSKSQKISPLQLACHSVHHFWLYMWLLSQVGSWNQRFGDFSGNPCVLLELSVLWSCSALTHLRKNLF